jgi:uncharacterized membrane protein (DUF106 family)
MTKATTYEWLTSYVPGTNARKEKLAAEQQARQEAKQKAEDEAVEQLRAKMASPEGQAAAEMLWKSEAPMLIGLLAVCVCHHTPGLHTVA